LRRGERTASGEERLCSRGDRDQHPGKEEKLKAGERVYALCWPSGEVAYLDLGKKEGLGQIVGIAVYTSVIGDAQAEHLEKYSGARLEIAHVSHEELLEAVNRAMPVSVFLDGHKIAGSVMQGLLHEALGIPIKNPRILDGDRVFGRR
jgi:hypothetical protein